MENALLTEYKPKHQLVMYEGNLGFYVEHYEIEEVNGVPVLSEGKPLLKRTLKKMLDLVLTTDKTMFATVTKLLPENVLFYDPRPGKTKLIWYNKASERTLHGINKDPVNVKLPAFVFVLDDGDLSMYATKTGSRRPDQKTQLFHSPLPNVYENAKVCMGNVKKPTVKIEIADLIAGWEKAFWGSEFTDHLWNKNAGKQLKAAIKSKKQFPNSQLLPMKRSLNTLL